MKSDIVRFVMNGFFLLVSAAFVGYEDVTVKVLGLIGIILSYNFILNIGERYE